MNSEENELRNKISSYEKLILIYEDIIEAQKLIIDQYNKKKEKFEEGSQERKTIMSEIEFANDLLGDCVSPC